MKHVLAWRGCNRLKIHMGRDGICVWLGIAVLLSVALTAQDTFRFSFQPPVGYRFSIVYDVTGSLVARGLPNIGQGQNLRFEATGGSTEFVREQLGGAVVIETTFDSVFGRYRTPDNSSWIELPIPYQPVGVFGQIRDEHYTSTILESSTDPFFLNAARGLRMKAELPVPDRSVNVGSTWPVEFTFPFTSQIPSESALLITIDLVARGTARLDSVVSRSLDTLAFVSMTASLDAVTVGSAYSYPGGDLPVTLAGSLSGSHIWSTGWHGWAGSLLNVVVDHQVEGLPGASLTTTLFSSVRVAP